MALKEYSGLMKPVDKNGEESIFYPVNRAEDVAGLEEEIKEHLKADEISYNGRTVQSALEDLEAIGMKIIGVEWDYSNPSTALTRLTRATDPNHFVTVDITEEPVSAVGTGTGSSPFDAYMPWAGMEEYNIINGVVSYARGASGFSRQNNDTMVYIPIFYFHIEKDATAKRMRFYVSDQPRTGFAKHPGSGRYVSRYHTGAGYVSKTGINPLVNITRSDARIGSANKGSGWCQYDYTTWCAIWLLYLVEFADWDSQTKIGKDLTFNAGAGTTGTTDSMVYHTGYGVGDNGKVAAQYRHIESLWGNVYNWVDGLNFCNGELLICTDPSKWADNTDEGYESAWLYSDSHNFGYVSELAVSESHPFAFIPVKFSAGTNTYIPDVCLIYADQSIPAVGGNWNSAYDSGLCSFGSSYRTTDARRDTGSRLLYIRKGGRGA